MTSSGADGVRIQLESPASPAAACGSCRAHSAAPASLHVDTPILPDGVPAVGARVRLAMPGQRLAALAALFYLSPLLAMFAAAVLAARADLAEGVVALCAFAALGLAFVLNAVLLRGRLASRLLPVLHWEPRPARICLKDIPPPPPAAAARTS